MRQYTDELKAQVVSARGAGASWAQINRTYGVSAKTARRWVEDGQQQESPGKTKSLANFDFDGVATELIDDSVRAFSSILRAAEDQEWIKAHSPSEAAVLAGVIADKLYRLLGAIEREPAVLPAGQTD